MNYSDTIIKTVPFKYCGKSMKYGLSMGLFSSHDIDLGSRLLLKTLAIQKTYENKKKVLDMGCGCGVLGLSLSAILNDADVTLIDRDFLALKGTEYNASLNHLSSLKIKKGLFFEELDETYDLIVSNLPAKAGENVFKNFFSSISHYLSADGIAAVVIVDTLSAMAEEYIQANNLPIVYKESTKQYTVFHFTASRDTEVFKLASFYRTKTAIPFGNSKITLNTAFNIPSFDSLSYKDQNCLVVLSEYRMRNRWKTIVINQPEQGLIPSWLAENRASGASFNLSGRDYLQLRISKENLETRINPEKINLSHCFCLPNKLEDPPDLVVLNLTPIPKTNWIDSIWEDLSSIIEKDSLVCINGKSSDVQLFLKKKKGSYKTELDVRSYGFRSILLIKQ